jgi:tRNA threonylcarbamoyladenosine biosynthesis protein TsaB
MRLLAIDTATPRPSLAVVADAPRPWLAELPLLGAEALAPAVASLLREAGLAPRDLDRIAVVSGPGSFTGLRSSLAFARGLARASGALLVAVPTFEAAHRALPTPSDADLVLEALRGEVHRRRRRRGELRSVEERLLRRDAEEAAARDGVELVDLARTRPRLAEAAAALARSIPAGNGGELLYGRPPAAEERFGPGGGT